MDLTTATPVEIDTLLAEIYGRLADLDARIERQQKYAKDMAEGLARKAAKPHLSLTYASYTQERMDEIEAKIADLQEEWMTVSSETATYDAEFTRRGGWTRFFLVTNNGGHIHSSMGCQTCNKRGKRTQFGWIVERSGQSEAQALESLVAESAQTILCSVCFPNAPVEWTVARQDPSICSGSGKYYDPNGGKRMGYAAGNWATCSGCGTRQTVSAAGKIRKHRASVLIGD